MPWNDIWRWVHDVVTAWGIIATGGVIVGVIALIQGLRNKPMPKRWQIGIACFFLLVSLFKAWQQQYHMAIEEAEEIKDLKHQLDSRISAVSPSQSQSVHGDREIEARLSLFLTDATKLSDDWRKVMSQPDKNLQLPFANAAKQLHAQIDSYLRTIPRGSTYSSRLNAYPRRVCAEYPLGYNEKTCRELETLYADIAALEEFLKEPNLGQQ